MSNKLALTLLISIFLVGALVGHSIAADYYVDGSTTGPGSDGNSGGSGDPWLTITHALDWIEANDPPSATNTSTIHIAAGTYAASSNGETFPLCMKSWVSLLGEDEATTILDAENNAYHVIDGNTASDITIQGFTITGGNANGAYPHMYGGGIKSPGPRTVIAQCTITKNVAKDGGGIYCPDTSSQITQCIISQNTASQHGGGIYTLAQSPTITDCTVTDNTADLYGGGIYCQNGPSPSITDCTVSGNVSGERGGGICCWDSSPSIKSCTITSNAQTSYEGSGGGIYIYDNCAPTVENCTIDGNTAGGKGGGISCQFAAPARVEDCAIGGNTAVRSGGGISCDGGSPTIKNCTVDGNTTGGKGGGISCEWSSLASVSGCMIADNYAEMKGGGIYCYESSRPELTNCLIVRNTAGLGGGTCCETDFTNGVSAPSPIITNCTIADNTASEAGGAIYCCDSDCEPTVLNTILWSNEIAGDTTNLTITYSDVEGGWSGSGTENIDQEPLFVGGYYLSHIAAGQGADSPCIDTGWYTSAYHGVADLTTRTDGVFDTSIVDMGYHYAGPYDSNGDEPISATIDIDPNTINLKSKGKYITCYIELPTGYDVNDIDISMVILIWDGSKVSAETSPTEVGDYDSDSNADLMVKFDRASVHDMLSGGSIELEVSGSLTGGPDFEGSDVVNVIDKGKEHTALDHSSVEH